VIIIDGSLGEGGGQILRTSLALSAITGKAFQVKNIRANRSKPGLMRQHLTGVEAVAAICHAKTDGANLHSKTLSFIPGVISGGNYEFNIGTAGSTTLIFQTILYPLLYGNKPSRVVVTGGTHNDMAPPFEFIKNSFLPILQGMGASVELELKQAGFYPAGGGSIVIEVKPPVKWKSLSLLHKGKLMQEKIMGVVSNLPINIIEREVKIIEKLSGRSFSNVSIQEYKSLCPGNLVAIVECFENINNVFTGFGDKSKSAEVVGEEAYLEFARAQANDAPVPEHLADQLLLPMALAGSGEMRITEKSLHFITNAEIIQLFLEVAIDVSVHASGGFLVKVIK
jgi:RNA 3'-terminal phosphate cyclase (ATP)